MCRLHAPLTLELGHLFLRAGLSIQLGALLVVYLSAKYKKTKKYTMGICPCANAENNRLCARCHKWCTKRARTESEKATRQVSII